MSARNARQAKKLRMLERSLRKGRLPAYIDLVEWLLDRRLVSSRREAQNLILAGKVKSESHEVGFIKIDGTDEKVIQPRVPASLRGTLVVVS